MRSIRPGREVVYQIFPDRWKNARPEINPVDDQWQWKGKAIRHSSDVSILTAPISDQHTFFGGDLEGVRQSLDYLDDLGVTALYLTPIFGARTTHRYDTVDYHSICPLLGTRADFEALVADMRKKKMALILDGVLNHTSDDHPWHLDTEMRKNRYIMKDESSAMGWMGSTHLPKLDTQNPEVVRELLGVLDAWPEVDLWRLDAAHLLPQKFLCEVRKHVSPRPILVEDWNHAGHYFSKGLADGVTNFLFRESLKNFFMEDCSPETLLERLQLWINAYPKRALGLSWNFLDNHDTERFITLVGRERFLRALVLLFTLPGTPLLYHGIEVGMPGKSAGESRTPMEWNPEKWDREIYEHVKALIRLRKDNPVLATGRFKPLYSDNRSRVFAFERVSSSARAVIAINDGYHASHGLGPGEWKITFEKR